MLVFRSGWERRGDLPQDRSQRRVDIHVPKAGATRSERGAGGPTMAQTTAIPLANDYGNVSVRDATPITSRPRLLLVDLTGSGRTSPTGQPRCCASYEYVRRVLTVMLGDLRRRPWRSVRWRIPMVLVHPADRAGTLPDTDRSAVAGVLPVRLPRSVAG